MHNSSKVATQIDRVVNKAFVMQAFISMDIEYRSCKKNIDKAALKFCSVL